MNSEKSTMIQKDTEAARLGGNKCIEDVRVFKPTCSYMIVPAKRTLGSRLRKHPNLVIRGRELRIYSITRMRQTLIV